MATVPDRAEDVLPAYVAYLTLKNFVERFRVSGIPARIDKTVMAQLSGGTQSHLTSSLRFLELIGPSGEPTPRMESLVNAENDEDWSKELAAILLASYADILKGIDLRSATPGQLEERFRDVGKASGSTLDKSIRFFLAAAKDAKIEVSAHLTNSRKTRAPRKSSGARSSKIGTGDEDQNRGQEAPPRPAENMREFPVFFKGKDNGKIVVPSNITPEDCKMFTIALQMIEAYAAQDGG